MVFYLSLCSGIGAFEYSISSKRNYKCIGFSEIDKHAIEVYSNYFPTHVYLGDLTKKTFFNLLLKQINQLPHRKQILVIAGFPCQNISKLIHTTKNKSLSKNRVGIKGEKSKLFYSILKIIKFLQTQFDNVHFIFENVYNENVKNIVTKELKKLKFNVYEYIINGQYFTCQKRIRLFWTSFLLNNVNPHKKCLNFKKMLDPVNKVQHLIWPDFKINNSLNKIWKTNKKSTSHYIIHSKKSKEKKLGQKRIRKGTTRLSKNFPTSSNDLYSKTITQGTHGAYLIDYRIKGSNNFIIREYSINEICKLFGFPKNYLDHFDFSYTTKKKLLANTIIVPVLKVIMSNF